MEWVAGIVSVRECDAAVDARLGAARQRLVACGGLRMGTDTVTDTEKTEAVGDVMTRTNKAQLTGDMALGDVGEIWADLCSVS